MRWTAVLRRAAKTAGSGGERSTTASSSKKKSLALSVYFKQPELGMKDFEILSRASAFLLGVDPPTGRQGSSSADDDEGDSSPYAGHLEAAERERQRREYKRKHQHSQPGGPAGRDIMELGWLEFVPKEVRPKVHVACSSHVLSPFLWKDYYQQDWLSKVRQEHCAYSLEVYDPDDPAGESLAKFALNPEPFHHPEGRDIALVHFREEDTSLRLLRKLGVEVLHLRDPDKLYEKGEELTFDGFVVSERNVADSEEFGGDDAKSTTPKPQQPKQDGDDDAVNEDLRVFYPYKEHGKLSFHTSDRFFATTPEPLPDGLCGAPVLDDDGDLCGTVEGIVPVDHKDARLAGSAAFLPSYAVQAFVDYVERGLLENMMPKDLFQMVVTAKKTNSIGGGVFKADKDGKYTNPSDWEEAYDLAINGLKKRYSQGEVDEILKSVEGERKEVLDIMDEEGGDLDEIIRRVRLKSLQMREMVRDQYSKGQEEEASSELEDEPKKA